MNIVWRTSGAKKKAVGRTDNIAAPFFYFRVAQTEPHGGWTGRRYAAGKYWQHQLKEDYLQRLDRSPFDGVNITGVTDTVGPFATKEECILVLETIQSLKGMKV